MFRVQSIKRKLQWWVVAIFLLTGTAGWFGIWGLLYISKASKEASGGQLERARGLCMVQTDIAAARRLDRDLAIIDVPKPVPASALPVELPSEPPTPSAKLSTQEQETLAAAAAEKTAADRAAANRAFAEQALREAVQRRGNTGARLQTAWRKVGEDLNHLHESGFDATTIDALSGLHARVHEAVAPLVAASVEGRSSADLAAGPLADYDARADQLATATSAGADAALSAIRNQSRRLFDGIWVLQLALFVTVAAAQAFSAWAGWQLSRSLASQLANLKASAERISMGDLKSEVKIPSADVEIVQVGEALDRLRVSLSKAMERLTAKRTAGAAPHTDPQS